MPDLFLLALLAGDEACLSPRIAEMYTTTGPLPEVFRPHLPGIDEREHEAVG